MGQAPKLTVDQRELLIRLKVEGRIAEMKALALHLGVSKYYGTILERRLRAPYERSRKGWGRARKAGQVIA